MNIVEIPNAKQTSTKSERIGGLFTYMDKPGDDGNEKCLHYEAVNFLATTRAGQILECIALAEESTRSKDPIDHWVLSFKETEKPTVQQAREAVRMFIRHCGLADHQYTWAVHDDTDNRHIHVALNRVHPETHRVIKINKGFTHEAAQQAAALIEKKQGWETEPGARYTIDDTGKPVRRDASESKPVPSTTAQRMEVQKGEKSDQRIGIEDAGPVMHAASTWKELHASLAAIDMRLERKGSGAIIYVGDALIGVKASTIDKKLSFAKLQEKLGPYEPIKEIHGTDYYHHSEEPDAPRVGGPAANRVRKMSECGMAKLSYQTSNDTHLLSVAAPASGRRLDELRRLSRRAAVAAGASSGVTSEPLVPGRFDWERYQSIRDDRLAAKADEVIPMRKRHELERAQLRRAHAVVRSSRLSGDWSGKGVLRNAIESHTAGEYTAQKSDLYERQRIERRELSGRFPSLPIYKEWAAGREIVNEIFSADTPLPTTTPRDLVAVQTGPAIHYHAINQDGNRTGPALFVDWGSRVAVISLSDVAVHQALTLAAEKWPCGFFVRGSQEFRRKGMLFGTTHALIIKDSSVSAPDELIESVSMKTNPQITADFELYSDDDEVAPAQRKRRARARELVTEHIGDATHYYAASSTGKRSGPILFSEHKNKVLVHDSSEDSLLEALRLSHEKWPGGFKVKGDAKFRAQCAKLAAEHGFNVLNPELADTIAAQREAIVRQARVRERSAQPQHLFSGVEAIYKKFDMPPAPAAAPAAAPATEPPADWLAATEASYAADENISAPAAPPVPAVSLTLKRDEVIDLFGNAKSLAVSPGFQPGARALLTETIGGEELYIERNPLTGRRIGPVLFGATEQRVRLVNTTDATLAEALQLAAAMWPAGYQIKAPEAFKQRCAELAAKEGFPGPVAAPRKAAPVYAEDHESDDEGHGRMR